MKRDKCDDSKFNFTNIYAPPEVFIESNKMVYRFSSPYEANYFKVK